MIVYKISNTVNSKVYIGVTKRGADVRFRQHLRDARGNISQMLIHRAMRKHGCEAFRIEVLSEHECVEDMLDEEIRQIKLNNSLQPNGYNLCSGGNGVYGISDDVRRRKSIKAKENHRDPDIKSRHLSAIRSFHSSMTDDDKENRRILIRTTKEANGTLGFPEAALIAAAEEKRTPEARVRASKASKKVWATPGYKEKWSEGRHRKSRDTKDRFILCVDNGIVFRSTNSATEWVRNNGFPKAARNNLSLCCNGRYKSFCGMKWEWVNADTYRDKGIEVL